MNVGTIKIITCSTCIIMRTPCLSVVLTFFSFVKHSSKTSVYYKATWEKNNFSISSAMSEFINAGVIRMSKSIRPKRTEQSSRKPMMQDSMSSMHW